MTVYYGKVLDFLNRTTMEVSIAALGMDRRFIAEVSGNNYSEGDRIVVAKPGGARSEGFVVVGNLTRGLLVSDKADLQQIIEGMRAEINSINDQLTTLADQVGSDDTGALLAELARKVEDIQGGVSALSGRVGTAEANLGSLGSTMSSVVADIGALEQKNATQDQAISEKLDSSEYTASDVLSKLKGVDGSGSGLDADLFDGKDSSAFVLDSQLSAYKAGRPFAIEAGRENPITMSGTSMQNAVYFSSANRFTDLPAVVLTPTYSSYTGDKLQCHVFTVTKTSFTYRISMTDGSSLPSNTTLVMNWVAVQMTGA